MPKDRASGQKRNRHAGGERSSLLAKKDVKSQREGGALNFRFARGGLPFLSGTAVGAVKVSWLQWNKSVAGSCHSGRNDNEGEKTGGNASSPMSKKSKERKKKFGMATMVHKKINCTEGKGQKMGWVQSDQESITKKREVKT